MEDHRAPADAEGGVEIMTLDSIGNSIRCLSPASLIITPNPPNLFCSKLEALRSHLFTEYIRSTYTRSEIIIINI